MSNTYQWPSGVGMNTNTIGFEWVKSQEIKPWECWTPFWVQASSIVPWINDFITLARKRAEQALKK